jgi:DNA-binding CsgD family transcriptional regulator
MRETMPISDDGVPQTRALRAYLRNLRASTLENFAATTVESACRDLGFVKAMFSWVSGPSWRPESVFVSPDLDHPFEELVSAVDGSTVPLLRAPCEADLVRYRRPYVLDKRHYRQAYRPLLDLSNPVAYAAAPIVADGRTVAILHIDRHVESLGDNDLQLLARGAHLCGLSYSILRSARKLDDQQAMLRSILSTVSPGGTVAGPARRGADSPGAVPRFDATLGPARDNLTEREEAVLRLLAVGASNRAIAQRLFISDATVKSHIRHIFRKIGADTRAQAAAYYRARLSRSAVPG